MRKKIRKKEGTKSQKNIKYGEFQDHWRQWYFAPHVFIEQSFNQPGFVKKYKLLTVATMTRELRVIGKYGYSNLTLRRHYKSDGYLVFVRYHKRKP